MRIFPVHPFFPVAGALCGLILMLSLPVRSAQWTRTNGPGDGNVNTLVLQGKDLYAGTRTGGVFRSTNAGDNWATVNTGLPGYAVEALAVYDTMIFAATNGRGVFRSCNNGAQWDSVNNGLADRKVYALITHDSALFAGTYGGGVFQSTDAGAHWSAVNSGLTSKYILSLGFFGSDVAAGTSGDGIFVFDAGAATWSQRNSGLPNLFVFALATCGSRFFTGIKDSGVFVSADSGARWSAANNGLTNKSINAFAVIDSVMFVSTTGSGVFRSSDRGASWIKCMSGISTWSNSIHPLASSGEYLFTAPWGDGDAVWRLPLRESTAPGHSSNEPALANSPNSLRVRCRSHIVAAVPLPPVKISGAIRIDLVTLSGRRVAVFSRQYPAQRVIDLDVPSGSYVLNITASAGCRRATVALH